MRTAIYIEDGVVQLVLTPETKFEKNALQSFEVEGTLDVKIEHGTFYDCQGGWARHRRTYDGGTEDRSLILRVVAPTPPEVGPTNAGG